MKGFNTGDGYMGMVDGEYILFASEDDYFDYMEAIQEQPHTSHKKVSG